jgi:integrase
MGHADIQTTMKYVHHRSRAGDAATVRRIPAEEEAGRHK